MDEHTGQGPSHIDLTGSQFPVMSILETGGENPDIVALANTRKTLGM